MLTIPEATYSRMITQRADEMATRIAAWLRAEMPGWQAPPGSPQWAQLQEIVQAADAAGMDVETDYALFAWLALTSSKDWRAALSASDVRVILDDGAFDPASKLMLIEERLA